MKLAKSDFMACHGRKDSFKICGYQMVASLKSENLLA